MKHFFCLIFFILILIPCQISAQTAEEKGLDIVQRADQQGQGFGDFSADIIMTLFNQQGKKTVRKMRSRTLEVKNDGDKCLMIFDNPKDVKGTAMLTHSHKTKDDDQWLYLPALGRVKRISSSGRSGAFMASEFSYEDIVNQELEKYTYKWLRDEEYNGMLCYIIERIPIDPDSSYIKSIVWIDQKELRSWKIDFYDRKKINLKTLTSSKFKKYNNKYWRATEILMSNHQNKKKTRLSQKNFKFNTGLTEKDFKKNILKRLR